MTDRTESPQDHRPGPDHQPHSSQNPFVVIGRLLNGEGACTVALTRDAERHRWVLHPYGVSGMGICLTDPDAKIFARHILGRPR